MSRWLPCVEVGAVVVLTLTLIYGVVGSVSYVTLVSAVGLGAWGGAIHLRRMRQR